MYCDLHNHLYGSLSSEILWKIGKQNPEPRWHIFLDPYEKAFGEKIQAKRFFDTYPNPKAMEKIYYFNHPGSFSQFQAKFNLIIALVKFDEKEIRNVAHLVAKQSVEQQVTYAEYRLMFGKEEKKEVYFSKLMAACEGLSICESENKAQSISSKLVMSLHRDVNFERHYDWLKNWMEKESLVKKMLVGIDFCHFEEGYPPKDKKIFFQTVIRDNLAESSTALAILYHVGESFQDKTPFSAIRWILTSAQWGAHRLGHALALGLGSSFYKDQLRKESASERLDQLQFELENYEDIIQFGPYFSKQNISEERAKLMQDDGSSIKLPMDEKILEYLETFRIYAVNTLRKTNAVIESCPSSNLYIGMLPSLKKHPLSFFVRNQLRVTIGTDDLGIFQTNILEEFSKAEEAGLTREELDKIRLDSFSYKSTILSGRERD